MSDALHVTDLLPDLLHERLDARTRASVESHVATCGACRAELDVLRLARSAAVTPQIDTARIASVIPVYAATRRSRFIAIAWRIAAALLIVAGGASLFARDAGEAKKRVAESPPPGRFVELPRPVRGAESVQVAKKATPSATPELGTGETLHDLSESELRSLLREIAALDGVTSSETEVVIPAVGKGSL